MRTIVVSALLLLGLAFAPAARAQDLVFAGPGGPWQRLMTDQVLRPFEKECGCRVRYLPSTSNESLAKVIATKGSPEIDVMYSGDLQQVQGAMLGLFEPLDAQKVPNLVHVYPNLKPERPENVFLGVIGGGFVYNVQELAKRGIPPPTSVLDLLRPEFKGRIVTEGADSNYGMGLLILMAKMNGGGTDNIEPGFDMAKRLRENIGVFASNTSDTTRALQQGTAWIAWWGDARAQTLIDAGFPAKFATAKEGIPPIIMGASVVKGSKAAINGYKLINYLLAPPAQQTMAKILNLGPTVDDAPLAKDVADRVISGPEEVARIMDIDWKAVVAFKDQWIERWHREIQR